MVITTMSGSLIADDSLGDVQAVIRRNTPPDCELPIGTLTRQLLDWATKQLKDANVCETRFRNGEIIFFIGRLPQNVTHEMVVAHCESKGD